MLENQADSPISLNFGPKIPSSLKEEFTTYELPYNFAKYEIPSNFIVNYWRAIISLSIVVAAGYLLRLIEKLNNNKKRSEKVRFLLRRLRVSVLWNFFILIASTNFDGIVIFSSL